MDDEFMYCGRRHPSADLARRIRTLPARISQLDERPPEKSWRMRVGALAASVFVTAGAFAFPAVREGARAFLDLFRVVNFAAVSFDGNRLKPLGNQELGLQRLIEQQVETLKAPAEPQIVADTQQASAAAGISVRLPAWMPVGWEREGITVLGASSVRLTANTALLNSVLDSLGIDDLSVPESVNGQQAVASVPPVVHIAWQRTARNGDPLTLSLFQARQPEVSFPAGLDLTLLAEISLRVIGLDRAEAHRFAQQIDWRTTLIVPIPSQVGSFRQVNIQGSEGLLIVPLVSTDPRGDAEPKARRQSAGPVLVWSSGSSVFALTGRVRPDELLEMAHSMQ